jgi:hypothetical protein
MDINLRHQAYFAIDRNRQDFDLHKRFESLAADAMPKYTQTFRF